MERKRERERGERKKGQIVESIKVGRKCIMDFLNNYRFIFTGGREGERGGNRYN